MQIITRKHLKTFMEIFLILSAILLLGMVLWGLDRGFDITDEGYNLLGLLPGQEKQTVYSALQFVLLSRLFGWLEGLVQLRVLSIGIISLSALVFSWGILSMLRRLYPGQVIFSGLATAAWLVGGSFSFVVALSLTFSYNVFINACMLLTGGLVLYALSICDQPHQVRWQRWAWGAAGLLLLAALLVKPTAAVLLITIDLLGGLLFSAASRRSFIRTQCAWLLIGAGVGLGVLHFGFNAVQPILQAFSKGTGLHPGHLPSDLWQSLRLDGRDIIKALLPYLWLFIGTAVFARLALFSSKTQPRWAGRVGLLFSVLVILAAVLGTPLVQEMFSARLMRLPLLANFLTLLLVLASLLLPELLPRLGLAWRPRPTLNGVEFEKWVVVGILLALPLAAAFGTNNTLQWQIWLHITPWMALLLLLFQETQRSRLSWGLGWVIFAFATAWLWSEWMLGYLSWPYRLADNRLAQTESLQVRSARLNGIKVDSKTKLFLEEFDQIVAATKFQRGDGVIALYDMPGIVYLMEGYSPGEPWYMVDESWRKTLLDSMLTSKLARKSQYLVTNQFLASDLEQFLAQSEINFPDSYRQSGRTLSAIRQLTVTLYERRR